MYIINPIWLYYINLIAELKHFVISAAGICIIAMVIIIILILFYKYNESKPDFTECDKSNLKTFQKIGKVLIILSIILPFINCFIPTEESMNKMVIASIATTDNIKDVNKFIADDFNGAVDKITDSAIKIKQASSGDSNDK